MNSAATRTSSPPIVILFGVLVTAADMASWVTSRRKAHRASVVTSTAAFFGSYAAGDRESDANVAWGSVVASTVGEMCAVAASHPTGAQG